MPEASRAERGLLFAPSQPGEKRQGCRLNFGGEQAAEGPPILTGFATGYTRIYQINVPTYIGSPTYYNEYTVHVSSSHTYGVCDQTSTRGGDRRVRTLQ